MLDTLIELFLWILIWFLLCFGTAYLTTKILIKRDKTKQLDVVDKFGKRKTGNCERGTRTRNNHTTILEELTIIPTPKPLKPAVAVLVDEFRNIQSELVERYEKAAKALLKNEDLASVAYEKGDYVIIPLKNNLVRKYFTGISYANEEHINQLKKAFENLEISATYVHDNVRIGNLTYGEDEYESFVLNVRVMKFTLHGNGEPYYKYTIG